MRTVKKIKEIEKWFESTCLVRERKCVKKV